MAEESNSTATQSAEAKKNSLADLQGRIDSFQGRLGRQGQNDFAFINDINRLKQDMDFVRGGGVISAEDLAFSDKISELGQRLDKPGQDDFRIKGEIDILSRNRATLRSGGTTDDAEDALDRRQTDLQEQLKQGGDQRTTRFQLDKLKEDRERKAQGLKPRAGFASAEMQMNVEAGSAFASEIIGEGGLGRLGDDAEITAALDRTKRESEQGLSAGEFAAQRSKAFENIDRSTQTAARGISARLARLGVKGATAGRQVANVEIAGQGAKAGIERDLFLESANVKRQAFSDFKQSLGDIKTFDLAQAAREKDIKIQAGLGFAGLGSAETIAKFQAEATTAAANAKSGGGSSKF